jgi:hypothetical protein
MADEFFPRLREMQRVLAADTPADDAYAAFSVGLAKHVAATATGHMLAGQKTGVSEGEAIAAASMAMAFLVNALLYASRARGDAAAAERLLDSVLQTVVRLGAGDPEMLRAQAAQTASQASSFH